jgi:hypothetical protein
MAPLDRNFYPLRTRHMIVSADFTWQKDKSGYRLVKAKSASRGKSTAYRILPNGGERILIQPMEKKDLYLLFSYVDSPEKLLAFVEQNGLLGNQEFLKYRKHHFRGDWADGSRSVSSETVEGMPVDKYLEQAALFHEALAQKKAGPEALAAYLKSTGAPGASLGHLHLIPDKFSGARFKIVPTDLMQALWFQLGHVLASNVKMGTCLLCGQLFEAGAGGRRADAKFCSDDHRVLYNSLNRKPARRS